MQTLIVSLCILVAAAFMARKFYRTVKKNATCCGGSTGTPKCDGCSPSSPSCCCHTKQPLEELDSRK